MDKKIKVVLLWLVISVVLSVVVGIYLTSIISNNFESKPNQSDSKSQHDVKLVSTVRIKSNVTRVWPKSLPRPPNCGSSSLSDKIVGGRVLEFHEHPWTAKLEFEDVRFSCAGTLINYRYILTAAHCVDKYKLVGVLLGEHDLCEDIDCESNNPEECALDRPRLYYLEKIIIHPMYSNLTKKNDIALVLVNDTVVFNEITKPICLAGKDFYTQDLGSNSAFAIGWGLTNYSDTNSESCSRKIVQLSVWDQKKCAQMFNTTDGQICAGGEDGKDACTNDSGGPLVQLAHISPPSWYLKGIISYGFNSGCGIKGYPGVYTNVSEYMDWIIKEIGEN